MFRVLIPIGLLIALPVAAQIVPATDGTNTQIRINNNQTDVFGGTRSSDGTNLFHSFEQFNLAPSQIANIQSNPELRNIFMRVNGRDSSMIDGLLQVSGGHSNLFLINPSGILFGKDARLNLPGAFSATTATGVQFENGTLIGTPNYANLNGNPTRLIFEQPSAIANFGQLAVRSGHPLKFQNPTEATFRNWNSTTLSELLAKGSALRDATELTMTADGKIQLSGSALTILDQVDLLSEGRSIDIQAPRIHTQSINTTLLANSAGSVSLTGLNGQPAQSAIVGNIITPNQDVMIRANQISTQFILTNASPNPTNNGAVALQSQDFIRVGGVLTNGKSVTLSTAIDQPGSFVQSGYNSHDRRICHDASRSH